MKKTLCLLLCAVLAVTLFSGCQTAQPEESTEPQSEHVLQVGYGRTDISPQESVPLAGYSNGLDRMSTEVADPLYATCIALSDEAGNTVLLYHLDLCSSASVQIMKIRAAISNATGIPFNQILASASHTHAAPNLTTPHESIDRYLVLLENQMIQSAKDALADRKPAKMYINAVYPEKLNFNRHYIMADGRTTGYQYAVDTATVVAHVAEPDNQMQLLKFVREGGKDVVMVNWQTHPHRGTASYATKATSDIVGVMRDKMEADLDCLFAYFIGASGNINPWSMISSENITKNYIQQGQALAQYAIDGKDSYQEAAFTGIKLIQKNHKGNQPDSQYTVDIPLYAFSLGDVAFVTAPNELFSEIGETTKAASPFKSTFVVTCTNGSMGYLPVAYAFEYDSYEPNVTRFDKGTGEAVAESFIQMLNELKNSTN